MYVVICDAFLHLLAMWNIEIKYRYLTKIIALFQARFKELIGLEISENCLGKYL